MSTTNVENKPAGEAPSPVESVKGVSVCPACEHIHLGGVLCGFTYHPYGPAHPWIPEHCHCPYLEGFDDLVETRRLHYVPSAKPHLNLDGSPKD